jgi:hypothetical protein
VIDRPELVISGLVIAGTPWVVTGVILTSPILLGDDDAGGAGVGGIRSGRGGVLGVHFAVDNPSFGEV